MPENNIHCGPQRGRTEASNAFDSIKSSELYVKKVRDTRQPFLVNCLTQTIDCYYSITFLFSIPLIKGSDQNDYNIIRKDGTLARCDRQTAPSIGKHWT